MAQKQKRKASELENQEDVVLNIEPKNGVDKNKIVQIKPGTPFVCTWGGAQGILERGELDGRKVSLAGVLIKPKKGSKSKPTIEPIDDDVYGTIEGVDEETEFTGDPGAPFIPGIPGLTE